jgi:hypothetical protein
MSTELTDLSCVKQHIRGGLESKERKERRKNTREKKYEPQ